MNQPIECIRALARDMVANSNSGHIGMSLGASSLVYALFRNILNVSPKNPDFINRDRLVYSAGHCTPLIYSILHMCGYDITIDDLRKFRQIDSATPGHAEVQTCGVDCSTGALGQGIANAVGLAMAEKHLAGIFNKDDLKLFDHYTYAIVGEGCLMEGVSYEAMSLAGELNLNKLIVLYDCNKVTLDGDTQNVFTEDIEMRVRAQGWDVFKVSMTDDLVGITNAILQAKQTDRPSLVIVPSVIGLGTQNAGENTAHAMKITKDDALSYREMCNLPTELFNIPISMYRHYQEIIDKADKMEFVYSQTLEEYRKKYKKEFELFCKFVQNDFKLDFDLNTSQVISGRDAGSQALNALYSCAPNLFGGSADLASSTKVFLQGAKIFTKSSPQNSNICFGIREFSMACACTGIALHGGLVSFCSTFLTFADYMKSAIRMCALMRARVIFVFTHDCVRVGEDGASHEPIEQIDMLRSIPNLKVFRPCSISEVEFAYKQAYTYQGPSAIILTKENLCNITPSQKEMQNGIYPVAQVQEPQYNIFASGYEMHLAIKVRDLLLTKGYEGNIYSVLQVDKNTQKTWQTLPSCVIECSSGYTLENLTYPRGILICTREFGLSGKADDVYYRRGFDAIKITTALEKLLQKQ